MTLRDWQTYAKPVDQLIVQASTVDGEDGVTAMSIGMGYGFIHYKNRDLKQVQFGDHSQLVLCAISTETDKRRRGPVRETIVKRLQQLGINNHVAAPTNYFAMLPSYKYVVSPEGNGIDCHRHYEALMAGCVPIIEDHPLMRVKYNNMPVLWTTDYSEITPEYLDKKWAEMLDATWDFSRLFLSAYSFEEQFMAKFRGNYWTQKLTGQMWYGMDSMHVGIYIDRKTGFYIKSGIQEFI